MKRVLGVEKWVGRKKGPEEMGCVGCSEERMAARREDRLKVVGERDGEETRVVEGKGGRDRSMGR